MEDDRRGRQLAQRDRQFFTLASVGAIDVSRSNPKIVYVGSGEGNAYQHTTAGDGVWKSSDGGETWTNVPGSGRHEHIARILIHPTNPDIVYVAARGDIYGTNPERGIFRTKDGGKTWERVLYKSDKAGAIGLSMDPANPNILIASLNEYARLPWDEVSGGPDSGIYKTDGRRHHVDRDHPQPGAPEGRHRQERARDLARARDPVLRDDRGRTMAACFDPMIRERPGRACPPTSPCCSIR